jgi:uroporphyrinogen decarboxylase
MTSSTVSSLERTLTTLAHKEPDRVPVFLLLTTHGAREVGTSIEDYFATPRNVVEGQLRMRNKFGHDCFYGFHSAALEMLPWGGSVQYHKDGPPNAGPPIIRNPAEIRDLISPEVESSPQLENVLEVLHRLKVEAAGQVPVIGVVMSPFSLPVMQMGFGPYLNLISDHPELFERLMQVNEAFCIAWANAQLNAGATAIVYFDPVSSPTIIPPREFQRTGLPVGLRTLSQIAGPTAIHFASGRALPIVKDIANTGTAAIGVGPDDAPVVLKDACRGRLTLIGNLNGIEMCRWSPEQTEREVKNSIATMGAGGGFIIGDAHGEVPFQVPDQVLRGIMAAARKWGTYPLDWANADG